MKKVFTTTQAAWEWQRNNRHSVLAQSPLYSVPEGWELRYDTTVLPPAT